MRRDFFPDLDKLEQEVTGEASSDRRDVDTPELRLDQFLNRYESEDDASFAEILTKNSEIHRQKYAWLHKQEEQARLCAAEKLAIKSSSDSEESGSRQAGVDSWTYTAKNSLMYIPDGVESSAVESIEKSNTTRKIRHCNTRLPEQFVHKVPNLNTKKPVQEKVGVDGKIPTVDNSPRVNDYGFLSTPQIKPGMSTFFTNDI